MSTGTDPRRLGKYVLHQRLGHGGVSEVWKAFDTNLQRYVAIKLLHTELEMSSDFVARFEREARMIASLHHPNIVQIHDFQITYPLEAEITTAYMVMDYVEGGTLATYIGRTSRAGKFPSAADIVHLFTSISLAVDYAHERGMIHRDIKPDNILLDKRALKPGTNSQDSPGEPILSDFGIAKLLGTSTGMLSGRWLGTAFYISPEQVQGDPGNERSDIYSLGVILYEICTGVLPFQGHNPSAIMRQRLEAPPPSPERINPNISPALQEVILRALARNPSARFPSASSMAMVLAEAFNLAVPERLRAEKLQPSVGMRDNSVSPPADVVQTQERPASTPPVLRPLMTPSMPSTPLPSAHPVSKATPTTPPGGMLTASPVNYRVQHTPSPVTPVLSPPPMPAAQSTLPPVPRKRRRGLLVGLIVLLLVVLAGSGISALYVFPHNSPKIAVSSQIAGHAFFVSSGQLQEGKDQGINDEMQIDLSNVPNPTPGKSYYAWLLGDKHPVPSNGCGPAGTTSVLLGTLTVQQGVVHYLYPGDAQHSNLISCTSRLVITEDSANTAAQAPPLDQHTWRYYAEIPQMPNPKILSRFSALDDIRHLLYEGPDLKRQGIRGGLDIRFLKDAQKIWEWGNSARDTWGVSAPADTQFIHRQIARILDYLDGVKLVKTDLPGIPLYVDPKLALVPMLDLPKHPPNSYIARISRQLNEIHIAPSTTAALRNLATEINSDIVNDVKVWLGKVYSDSKELVAMNDSQLLSKEALAVLNDLQVWLNYVLIGRLDPSTNKVQAGAVGIHYNIQHLATFDLQAFRG